MLFRSVLVIETNFDGEDFCRVKVSPRPGQRGLPYGLLTAPKPHQETGILWLQDHWIQGSKGCLLADDMGLGKTYQALGFLAWINEQMNDGAIPRKPLLVVAPVGLLANWEKEHGSHLRHGGLGEPLRAYGSWIKFLKRGSHVGGTASLDTAELSRATWILANYEAISEYQISFGAIEFGAVIFDEAHDIEDVAGQYFGVSVSSFQVEELIRDVAGLAHRKNFNSTELDRTLRIFGDRAAQFFTLFGASDGRKIGRAHV